MEEVTYEPENIITFETPEEPEQEEEEEEEKHPGIEVYDTTVETLPPSVQTIDDILDFADGNPIILDFQYDACEPCQEIAEYFESIKDLYPEVIFRKVDIFNHQDMLAELGV